MKISKEITNGLLIFLGIIVLFFVFKIFGLEKVSYLRFFNGLIVFAVFSRMQQENVKNGIVGFGENFLSIFKAGLIGVFLSVIALAINASLNGGQTYLETLSHGFLFGKNPTVNEYCFGLLIEGIASVVAISFICIQAWQVKTTKTV
jgi:hypothetical protein